HGHTPERHWVKESRSIWFWGLLLPLLVFAIAWLTHGLSLLLLLGYPLMTYRIYRHKSQTGFSSTDALLYSLSCMIGKFPQVQGQIQFHLNRLLGQRSNLVEYKTVLNSNS
ncbi:MAG: glycosyltransferase family 2 protein, partial [Moorea sp. SIO3I7]|nr:glycosyltransferase family 2 protein [Moorena sp. SIO3I7]